MFDWLKKNSNNFGRGPAKPGTLEYAEQEEARRLAKIEKMTNPSFAEDGLRQVCDMNFNAWVVRSRPLENTEPAEYARELMAFQFIKDKNLSADMELMDGAEAQLGELCLKIANNRNNADSFKAAFDECFLFICKVRRNQAAQAAINS